MVHRFDSLGEVCSSRRAVPRLLRSHTRLVAAGVCGVALAGCVQREAVCPPVEGSSAGASAPASAAGASGGASAGTPANLKGVDMLGPSGLKAFSAQGEVDKVSVSIVPVTGQPFKEAWRAEIKKGSGNEYAVQLQAKTTAPVDEGDILLATFYFRAAKPFEDQAIGQTQFVFEQAKSPYTKSVMYNVDATTEWRKIQLPFLAKEKYAAGDAQMIFRLGYEPEVIEIGGVTVENFAKKARMGSLPSTPPWTPPKVADPTTLEPTDGGALAIVVDPTKTIRPISPYVYGVNSQKATGLGTTVRRMGGNRQTAYNWELNASNAGADYRHQSDDWPCTVLGYKKCGEPGAQFTEFAAENKTLGAETIATVPMLDYVSADKSLEVHEGDKPPSKRWLKSLPHKPSAFADPPDRADDSVYQDEFVHFLVHKLGKAKDGGIKFYSLDNEPALWPITHPRIHPDKTSYQEVVTRTEALAKQITTLDPSALVLGGVMFGWSEYLSLSDAPDSKEQNAKYDTYVDFFLASMKNLEAKNHRRLMHVFDVHWYPEARGAKRITDEDNSPKTIEARVQAPRALWDPTYRERSWIDEKWGKSIRLVPWLKEKIDKRYPGTKLSMTEYDFGGSDHISGGLAQVDVLGVLGREGVFLANYWGKGAGNGEMPPYIAAAFKLYRNFDGKGGTFGDTAVTTTADVAKTSVFAASDSKRPNQLFVVVINKDLRAKYSGTVTIRGAAKYTSAQAYSLDKSGPEVRPGQKVELHDNRLQYALPPLSATLFVCEKR